MSLYSTEMGDHLGIIIFSSILLILLNSLISLSELHKTPITTRNYNEAFKFHSISYVKTLLYYFKAMMGMFEVCN